MARLAGPAVGASIIAATLYNLFVSIRQIEPSLTELALNVALVLAVALATALPRRRVPWAIAQVTALVFIFASTLINFFIGGDPARVLLWMPWLAVVYLQNGGWFMPRIALALSGGIFLASLAAIAPYVLTGALEPGTPAFDALAIMALFHLTLIAMLYNMASRIAFELVARIRAEAALEAAEQRSRVEAELAAARLKLARGDRSLSVSALAESIAHEIRQPLTAISAAAQAALNWIQRDPPQLDEVAACGRRILADAQRAGEIVVSTRDLIRREIGVRAPVDIGGLIAEVATILRNETAAHGIMLATQSAAGLPRVPADAGQLRQLVVNLALNAIEASRANARGSRPVWITADGTEHFIVILVEDRGAGFANGGERRAFEPFFTTKTDGMGLGLSICRRIAEAHGGAIEIEALQRGARVSVTLPVASM